MQSAFDAIITGRVQMVMFRDFTQRSATALGLVGEVENLADGTVRVHAEGEREKLDVFITRLEKGPLFARVDSVSVSWGHPSGAFRSFSIKYQ